MYKKITEDVSSRQEDLNVAGYQLLSYWQKIVFSIPSFWKNALFNKPQFCTEESFSNWRKGLIASLLWNGNDSHDFINISWVPMVNPIFCEILSFSLNFPFKDWDDFLCSFQLHASNWPFYFQLTPGVPTEHLWCCFF